jgi:hypothetical protein
LTAACRSFAQSTSLCRPGPVAAGVPAVGGFYERPGYVSNRLDQLVGVLHDHLRGKVLPRM